MFIDSKQQSGKTISPEIYLVDKASMEKALCLFHPLLLQNVPLVIA